MGQDKNGTKNLLVKRNSFGRKKGTPVCIVLVKRKYNSSFPDLFFFLWVKKRTENCQETIL